MMTDAQRKAVRHLARIAAQKLLEQESARAPKPSRPDGMKRDNFVNRWKR